MSASPPGSLRPTWAEIDLDAIEANLGRLRARVGTTPILAVVKADAYGHGAVEVARALAGAGTAHFGVALPEEGVELRRAGVRAPVLLLGGFAPPQADLVLAHDLTPAVFRADQVEALAAAAGRRGGTARVHLKIDTGMGRLGVPAEDVPEFARRVAAAPRLDVEGVFSHLATAEDPDGAFTRAQIALFARSVEALRAAGLQPALLHLANSAGLLDHPPSWLSLVRPGLLLYGYAPGPGMGAPDFEPALTLRSRIIYLKEVAPGASLGYARTWIAARPCRIATLGIGYDDGLPFHLGNRGHVLVRGLRAPIVGRVSMDLTTIDVTGVPGAALGDAAIVLGREGGERLGADAIAAWTGTHAWEVLCGLGPRVPRIYLHRGRQRVVSRFDAALAPDTGVAL